MNIDKFKSTFFKIMKWSLIFELLIFLISNNHSHKTYGIDKWSSFVNGLYTMPIIVIIVTVFFASIIAFIDSFFKY